MIRRLLAFFVLIWTLGFIAFALWLPSPAPTGLRTDGVVVLTGAGQRIERALTVLEEKEAKRMLISGVDRDVKRGELAALYGRDEQLFECCIDLGFRAIDTRSNAMETVRWIDRNGIGSIRFVTSDWHMRRARLELDMALDTDIEIVEDAVRSEPSLPMLFKEYHKYLLRLISATAGI